MVLKMVCEYLYYNQKHAKSKDVADIDIRPKLCLELLIAADYLDSRYLATGSNWHANSYSVIFSSVAPTVRSH